MNVAVIIGIEQAVHQDVAQESLVGMAVGVDEAGNDDSVRGVDDRDRIARRLDVRPNLADPVALDQYVRLREVADLPVEGEDDAALEQNAAFTLHAGKLAVGSAGALRKGVARQRLRRGSAGRGTLRIQRASIAAGSPTRLRESRDRS